MGYLENGTWRSSSAASHDGQGRFVRADAQFRSWISADGTTGFRAEPGRYRLYASYACPWASRALIFRKLKRLDEVVSLSVVDPEAGENGWRISGDRGDQYLHELYAKARPDYTGRATVPVLWDEKTETIVNNESSEIIRMLNRAFDEYGDATLDFYPAELRGQIDEINAIVYHRINNGVYKAGFAKTQEAYDQAFYELFDTLEALERRLSTRRYLVGARITEADFRLLTTLLRFDTVYVTHFKCNALRLVDLPNLWGYTRELYQIPAVRETVDFGQIKRHYYWSHRSINPYGIEARGPRVDFDLPHDRGHLPGDPRFGLT